MLFLWDTIYYAELFLKKLNKLISCKNPRDDLFVVDGFNNNILSTNFSNSDYLNSLWFILDSH